MKEKDLQKWIASMIEDGTLDEHIRGREVIRAQDDAEGFISTFPIDSRLRKRLLESATVVLEALPGLTIVQEERNISLDPTQRLIPDIVTANVESGHIVLFELKKGTQTGREAVTELLAYDHELRNALPFLCNEHALLVVIATEFSTLLDHAVANAVLWQERSVLCLKTNDIDKPTHLEIHLPGAWWAMGQKGLRDDAFLSTTLSVDRLKENCEYDEEQIHMLYHEAAELISLRGTRNGSHGFVLLLKETWGFAESGWVLCIGYLNPFALLRQARERDMVKDGSHRLLDFLAADDNDMFLEDQMVPITGAIRDAKRLLARIGTPTVEGTATWSSVRAEWRARGILERVEQWGLLGDYAVDLWLNDAFRKVYFPSIDAKSLPWNTPTVGMLILDQIVEHRSFKGGVLSIEAVAGMALKLGFHYAIAANIAGRESKVPSDSALLQWSEFDVLPDFLEFVQVLDATLRKSLPPIVLIGGDPGKAARAKQWASEMIKWMSEKLLAENETHRFYFGMGVEAVYVLDTHLTESTSDEKALERMRELLVNRLRQVLSGALPLIDRAYVSDSDKQAILRLFESAFDRPIDLVKPDSIPELVAAIPDTKLIQGYRTVIPRILDLFVPLVQLDLDPPLVKDVDWDWLRDQILAAYARGVKYPVLSVDGTGEYGIGQANPDETPWAPQIDDPNEHVLVHHFFPGTGDVLIRMSWSEIRQNGIQYPGVDSSTT
ncbi:MAG: hypothetical protein JNM62_08610 [Flavobacteriales bacterium]|nr:hypothetical protein [Flavobacteriales bacterium]